jgi:hypothetical protein
MPIFASPDEPPRTASSGLLAVCPTTVTRCTGPGSYAVTVRPCAELADVFDALGVVPVDTVLVNVSEGGAAGETVLAFRQVPPDDAPAAARAGTPAGPEPAAPVPVADSSSVCPELVAA